MAELTTEQRNALHSSSFAGPDRSFPVNDIEHGRKALQLLPKSVAAGNTSASEAAHIRAKVHEKYPSIGRYRSSDRP